MAGRLKKEQGMGRAEQRARLAEALAPEGAVLPSGSVALARSDVLERAPDREEVPVKLAHLHWHVFTRDLFGSGEAEAGAFGGDAGRELALMSAKAVLQTMARFDVHDHLEDGRLFAEVTMSPRFSASVRPCTGFDCLAEQVARGVAS